MKALYRSGVEFWLPLPVIAALFWWLGNIMTDQLLNHSYNSLNKLQADVQIEETSELILAINVEIDQSRGMTTLLVRVAEPTLREVKYEFPMTEISQVEAAIAQELGISIKTVRKLASYRIED